MGLYPYLFKNRYFSEYQDTDTDVKKQLYPYPFEIQTHHHFQTDPHRYKQNMRFGGQPRAAGPQNMSQSACLGHIDLFGGQHGLILAWCKIFGAMSFNRSHRYLPEYPDTDTDVIQEAVPLPFWDTDMPKKPVFRYRSTHNGCIHTRILKCIRIRLTP